MSDELRAKWDTRYAAVQTEETVPCEVLVEYAHLLPATGTALELACGLGGNARFLAARGLTVVARDISPVAIEKLTAAARGERLAITAEVCDITTGPPLPESFDVIVVARFLERALAPAIAAALRPGGLLYYQTFTRKGASSHGPTNPAFRLMQNELLKMFIPPLELVAYREEGSLGDLARGVRGEAWLVARCNG